MIRFIRKIGRLLLYGGFGGARPYEFQVLQATIQALRGPNAEALAAQVQAIERMQRWNDDRMVIVGFENRESLPKLEVMEPNHRLARLTVKGTFGSVPVVVMTHKGILSSIAFRESPRIIKDNALSVEVRMFQAEDPGNSDPVDEEGHGPSA